MPHEYYPSYLGKKQDLQTLKTKEVLERFKQRNFKGSFDDFVGAGNDADIEEFYNKTKFKPVLGEEDFCEAIFQHLKKQSLSAEIVGADNIICAPDIDIIITEVAKYYKVSPQHIIKCSKRAKNTERRVAIVLCREVGGMPIQKIANIMNNVSYATISKTISRAKADPLLAADISKIKQKLLNNAKTINVD